MNLARKLEPEVMDTPEEANDYNSMDHSEVNRQFVSELIALADESNRRLTNVLDVGTGTALIPIELCRHHKTCSVTAIDLAENMLRVAGENVSDSELDDRIELMLVDAKSSRLKGQSYSCVMSNSIIHHIPEPSSCVEEMTRLVSADGILFVRDLMRPTSDEEVNRIVHTYAGDENAHSQQMFDDSLRAALTLDEMRQLVSDVGFDPDDVVATSDRHWTWASVV